MSDPNHQPWNTFLQPYRPCRKCHERTKVEQVYREGYMYIMGTTPRTCICGRSYYPYDILVIAIHGHYDLPLGGVPLDSISYGVFVGPDSEFNSGSRLYIEPGGLEDSKVPDGPLWTKEAASLAAARNAIRTALRIAEKGLSFSKLVIKTESQNMVTCMTETPSQSSAFDNAREMRRKNLMYCAELRKTAVMASTKGIEVMLWAVERGTNREAIQLAELAMKTAPRAKFQSPGR